MQVRGFSLFLASVWVDIASWYCVDHKGYVFPGEGNSTFYAVILPHLDALLASSVVNDDNSSETWGLLGLLVLLSGVQTGPPRLDPGLDLPPVPAWWQMG